MWSPWLLLRVARVCCCSHTAVVCPRCARVAARAVAARESWHQQLSKRLSAQQRRAQVQRSRPVSCLQDQAQLEATPHDMDVLDACFLVSLLCETPGNGRVRRNAESIEAGLSQQQRVAFVAAEAQDKAFPPLVGRFTTSLSTTRNERTTVRGPPSPHSHSTKKAALHSTSRRRRRDTEQRCSPSSREQQDSPSRSRRARPSRATRGTSCPSVVKCAPRRRRTAACSARCDEVIR